MIQSSLTINLATTAVDTQDEDKLIAVLKSADATRKDKADACRILARYGTEASVEPLAALLPNEEMSHMARYGLETIDSAKVDEALRAALGKVKGKLLAGVIGSLGVRKDRKCVKTLISLLNDPDPVVAQAAARALGKIGTREAAQALMTSLDSVSPENHLAFCEGLFRIAEATAASGHKRPAGMMYQKLLTQLGPHQVRAGAMKGLVLLRGNDGLELLVRAFNSDNFSIVQAAARTIQELPGETVIKRMAAELGTLPTDKQILLVQTLGDRADAAGLSAVMALAQKGEKSARIAAIKAIPMFQNTNAVPVLQDLSKDSDAEIAEAAKFSLIAL